MDYLQFAKNLNALRQQLHLTQEDIAQYVGVSRAAVSKWEKGLSYPDITLLPKIATFFNVSIDELLGYEKQMTKERIEQLYSEYSKRFAQSNFEEVQDELETLLVEYYSCYPLLLKIVQLYVNYLPKAKDQQAVIERALEITERVRNYSQHVALIQEANGLQGILYLMRHDADSVLSLFGEEPELDYGTEQLVLSAHAMKGNVQKAKEIAQIGMYQKLLGYISLSTESMMLHIDHVSHFEETTKRLEKLIELFSVEKLHPNSALVFYIKAATGFMLQNNEEMALKCLQSYAEICLKLSYPLELKGDDYFYLLDDWFEKNGQILRSAPRDDRSIKEDIVKSIEQNPLFAPLSTNSNFKKLIQTLKEKLNV